MRLREFSGSVRTSFLCLSSGNLRYFTICRAVSCCSCGHHRLVRGVGRSCDRRHRGMAIPSQDLLLEVLQSRLSAVPEILSRDPAPDCLLQVRVESVC
jgi:hypothetical protein